MKEGLFLNLYLFSYFMCTLGTLRLLIFNILFVENIVSVFKN